MHYNNYKEIAPENIEAQKIYRGYKNKNDEFINKLIIVSDSGIPLEEGVFPMSEEAICFYESCENNSIIRNKQSAIDMTLPENQINLIGLHSDLYSIGNARHNPYNIWLRGQWRNLLHYIQNLDFFIIGITQAPCPSGAFKNAYAIVVEYKDTGDQVWYHIEKSYLEKLRKDSLEAYNVFINKN